MNEAVMKNRLKAMTSRCYDRNNQEYSTNGGRGITVDERWLDPDNGLANFIEDVGYPSSEDAKLHRRDRNGNFTKDNMYWLQNTSDRVREQRRLYKMIDRCHNPKNPYYYRYGGRGVVVCERWRDTAHGLDNFIEDMGTWPGPDYSIDRIDNDGPYSPENCRWATNDEQYSNRSKNNIHYYDIDGVQMSSREICERVGDGCTPDVIAARYKRGSRGEELLRPMIEANKYDTPHGPMTTGEIAKHTGIPRQTITVRIKRNPNITWAELTTSPRGVSGLVAKTFDTLLGPLSKAQIAKIAGIGESTTTRRLAKGMTGTELFVTHHQNDPVYLKGYGYMNNTEYMEATGYKHITNSSNQRKDLSDTQGLLTMNTTAVHVLSDGSKVSTKDLMDHTQLKNELLTWLMVRYEIPAEVLWNHGPVEEYQVEQFTAKHTPGKVATVVSSLKFLSLLHVQLLRRGIDMYTLPSRERDVHTMMERIGIPTNRYVLIRIPTIGSGEIVVDTPDLTVLEQSSDSIIGAVEMVHGGNVRVHIPDGPTTEHQFIMSPTTGVGLVKQVDGTFDIKEYS